MIEGLGFNFLQSDAATHAPVDRATLLAPGLLRLIRP
jgi:hypothetical protein